jgi:hypothetical protein
MKPVGGPRFTWNSTTDYTVVTYSPQAQGAQRMFILCLPLIPQVYGTGRPANIKDNPPQNRKIN